MKRIAWSEVTESGEESGESAGVLPPQVLAPRVFGHSLGARSRDADDAAPRP